MQSIIRVPLRLMYAAMLRPRRSLRARLGLLFGGLPVLLSMLTIGIFGSVIFDEAPRAAQVALLISAGVLGTLFAGIGWVVAGALISPLQAVAEAAHRIRMGERGVSIPRIPGDDEVAALAALLSEALAALAERDRELQRLNRHLDDCVLERTSALEEANRSLLGQLAERERAERRRHEFFAMVSHELRTPLTAMRGSLGLLAGGAAGPIPDRARTMAEIAQRSNERLLRMVNDLLDSEQLEAGELEFHMEPLELLPLVEYALEANRSTGELRGVGLVLGGRCEAWVLGDGDRLLQVLANLLSNAAKHAPTGTVITLAVLQQQDRVRVEVTDCGPGVPEDFRERIFQKFARAGTAADRRYGGAGLGLSVSRAIVERHGGTISFTTAQGGTTFFFELPVLPAPVERAV